MLNLRLESERLLFRPIRLTDTEQVHALNLIEEVNRYNTLVVPNSVEETEHMIGKWVNQGFDQPGHSFVFCIQDKQHHHFIGLFGVIRGKPAYRSAELWYKLHPSYWNNGYATEAVKQMLHLCFMDLKLHRVEAGCSVENTASSKVLTKCGFQLEGRTRKKLPVRGQWHDGFEYSILEEDYNTVIT
mgnify:CR=1 FL=1